MINLLANTAAAWGLTLSPAQLDQFDTYATELRRWNERVNLTAITDETGIVTRHFLDSLRCAQSWGRAPQRMVDIGAGAGFPGLPLKILRPALQLTLVESIAKKAAFLRICRRRCGGRRFPTQRAWHEATHDYLSDSLETTESI